MQATRTRQASAITHGLSALDSLSRRKMQLSLQTLPVKGQTGITVLGRTIIKTPFSAAHKAIVAEKGLNVSLSGGNTAGAAETKRISVQCFSFSMSELLPHCMVRMAVAIRTDISDSDCVVDTAFAVHPPSALAVTRNERHLDPDTHRGDGAKLHRGHPFQSSVRPGGNLILQKSTPERQENWRF